MGTNVLSKVFIIHELEEITNEYLISKTVSEQRASIVAYLTFELMNNDNIDSYEVHLFAGILRSNYISGKNEITECYEMYLKRR